MSRMNTLRPAPERMDELWSQRMNALLARVRSRIPADVTPEEIEAAIRQARNALRQESRVAPRR